jgi:DnaJ-class molecular chaperone
VEKAYKKEIRKYHPDHFISDPAKAKVATQVSQILTESYQRIKDSYKK